ncbi:hypothetical protein [Streptomyces sp. NPDC056817]|uniref:hypothetical protein n=1 Tax=Streptomyces sp. NPDC056817 TaxID=3345950 RepID=UPI0036B27434
MPRLGDLTVEQLLDGADREMAYLVERLDKLARERGADPEHIEEVITSATTANVRSHLIVAQLKLREERQAQQEPAATAPDTTRPDPERSEYQSAEAMTAHLVALGIPAQTINTGGNCWASSITLANSARLELTDFPGDAWSWALYPRDSEQALSGHWGTADDKTAATKAKALIDAMGSLVA